MKSIEVATLRKSGAGGHLGGDSLAAGAIAIAAFGVRINAEIALPLATEETPTQYRVRR